MTFSQYQLLAPVCFRRHIADSTDIFWPCHLLPISHVRYQYRISQGCMHLALVQNPCFVWSTLLLALVSRVLATSLSLVAWRERNSLKLVGINCQSEFGQLDLVGDPGWCSLSAVKIERPAGVGLLGTTIGAAGFRSMGNRLSSPVGSPGLRAHTDAHTDSHTGELWVQCWRTT